MDKIVQVEAADALGSCSLFFILFQSYHQTIPRGFYPLWHLKFKYITFHYCCCWLHLVLIARISIFHVKLWLEELLTPALAEH